MSMLILAIILICIGNFGILKCTVAAYKYNLKYQQEEHRHQIKNRKHQDDDAQVPRQLIRAGYPIVPNYIHYLRLNDSEFSFINAICMLSVYRNHVPSKIFIHSYNSSLSGPHWEKIMQTKGLQLLIEVININSDEYKRNTDMNDMYHSIKLDILAKYGGIFLDKDMFIISNIDLFLEYEMVLYWKGDGYIISDKIIIASKHARFLRLWLKRYKGHLQKYKTSKMNCMEYASYNIIKKNIHVVKPEQKQFVINSELLQPIYNKVVFGWQRKKVIWLMEELVTPEIKEKITQYMKYLTTRKQQNYKYFNSKKIFTYELEEHEKDTIFQIIDDVYY